MLGYPRSKPSEIVFLAGIVLLFLGMFGSVYFQNPSLKTASQICVLLGVPPYLGGTIALRSGRRTSITGNPKYATSFQMFAIILWLAVVPLVLFWLYLRVHS